MKTAPAKRNIFKVCSLLLFVWTLSQPAIAQMATGNISFTSKQKVIELKVTNGLYIIGPDGFDPAIQIRRLLFTTGSILARAESCETFSCVDGELTGLELDIVPGPRVNYWMVLNNQLVQYSGSAMKEALILEADSPDHLKGKIDIDDTASGGAKIQIDFDLNLTKKFTK